jgi:hypothetical protein
MNRHRARLISGLGSVLFAAGLTAASPALSPGAQREPALATYAIAAAPPELRPLISRADLIVLTMQGAMMRELRAALDRGGADFAIHSSHIDVIGVIQRLAREEGIAAGRTSDRLRSPTNAPRPWAAPIVKANAGRRVREVEGFVADLGDRVGVMRPIAEGPLCRSCHGPIDEFPAGVRAELAERYPVDKATGFAEGEIRGWYWVELRKTAK